MANVYHGFKLFISSPRDVSRERSLAQKVIRSVSEACRDPLGLLLEGVTWESEPPLTSGDRSIQQRLTERVRECDGFILILFERYGTVEESQTESHTALEIAAALDRLVTDSSFMFLSYFRALPPNRDPGPQRKQVENQRDDLRARKGVWVREYSSPSEFGTHFTHDLYKSILKQRFATDEQKTLRRFWQVGTPAGHLQPRVAIIYPPVQRAYMASQKPDQIWLQRLTPHVVFEDANAWYNIDKTLRLVGISTVHSFGTYNLPNDLDDWNRVWLCMPRSKPATQCLERYKDVARFGFIEKQRERILLWRSPTVPLSSIEVHSPLRKYLRKQRAQMPGGECTAAHLNIVARDFAVIARFSEPTRRAMASGLLRDYFFAGLHGVGTWGVTWLLDRRFHLLEPYLEGPERDVQLLLQVTYKNGRIHDVVDVSDKPESYFIDQNKPCTIRDVIDSVQGS